MASIHNRLAPAIIVVTMLAGSGAFADDAPAHRQHGAHVHGTGRLNLAIEGGQVRIELDSPAANIVGFEHAAVSERDRHAVDEALTGLRDGDRLFRFPDAADCHMARVDIASPLIQGDHDSATTTSGHDEEKASHGHEPGDGDGSHADIDAGYHFECGNPDAIDRLDVGLFAIFPATKRLDVQFVSARRQGATVLDRANPVLTF